MYSRTTLKEKNAARQKSQRAEEEKKNDLKSDILCIIMPIYHISKICGLLPVRFVFRKAGRYSGIIDFTQVCYGIMLLLALTGGQCYGLYRDLRDGWQKSTRLSSESSITVTCSDVFAVISVAAVVILDSPRRWPHLQRALDKLVDIDQKLDVVTSSNLRKLSVTVISCNIAYLIITSSLDIFSRSISATDESGEVSGDKGPINYIPIYFMYLVIVTFEVQYAVVLFNIGERFLKLNQVVEHLSVKNNVVIKFLRNDTSLGNYSMRMLGIMTFGSPILANTANTIDRAKLLTKVTLQTTTNVYSRYNERFADAAGDNVAESVDQLITLHGILCQSVNCINKAYGAAILMGTISCLIHLIITPYFLYNHVYSRNPNNWLLLILQFCWMLFHLCRILLFVQPCHMVISKAKETGALVNRALIVDWSPEVQKQLKIFAIQLLQRPIEFSVCGLFYLNRSLITSIAGSVTTYLVILVQFQTADDTKGTKNLIENASELLKNVSNFKNIFSIK
ncbi:gustatory receptor for sugar taste 43a-like [Phymastichus coffea]|uniref:gustatory receptor for sugar taste 43a-like n=1 Tax=Phymastichus coffea TaxID=108790 RepID=UPI00273B424C|nr:gustatory receptor for sugar taste 43a-like [Phymastichus coffea]